MHKQQHNAWNKWFSIVQLGFHYAAKAEIYYDVCKHGIKFAIIEKSQNTSITFEYTLHRHTHTLWWHAYISHYTLSYALSGYLCTLSFRYVGGISNPLSPHWRCWVWPSQVKPPIYLSPSIYSAHVLHFYSTMATCIYMGHNLAKFQICSKLCALRGDCARESIKRVRYTVAKSKSTRTNVCLHIKCI